MNRTTFTTQKIPDRIAEVLRERVIDGSYAPGQRLTEAVIAAEFGVSHGPVRDALRLLQGAGLVTILPWRGAVVSDVSVREIRELYQVRAALVGLRARWIAEDPERGTLIAKVAGPIAKMQKLAGRNAAEYTRIALLVNTAFTESLTNRWLNTTLSALMLQTRRYTRLALVSAAHQRYSAQQWQALLEAIRDGDGGRAENIAAALSQATRDEAIRVLERSEKAVPAKKRQKKAAA